MYMVYFFENLKWLPLHPGDICGDHFLYDWQFISPCMLKTNLYLTGHLSTSKHSCSAANHSNELKRQWMGSYTRSVLLRAWSTFRLAAAKLSIYIHKLALQCWVYMILFILYPDMNVCVCSVCSESNETQVHVLLNRSMLQHHIHCRLLENPGGATSDYLSSAVRYWCKLSHRNSSLSTIMIILNASKLSYFSSVCLLASKLSYDVLFYNRLILNRSETTANIFFVRCKVNNS